MVTVTVGPRVEFDLDRYVRIRVWDPEKGASGGDRVYYLQRLTCYAHGKIDALRMADMEDPKEIDHLDGNKWNNHPDNLEPRPPEEHGKITRDREKENGKAEG